jgi:hypothetical protein
MMDAEQLPAAHLREMHVDFHNGVRFAPTTP